MSNVIQLPDDKTPLSQRLKAVLDGEQVNARDAARAFISRPEMAPVHPDIPKEQYREKTLGWIKDMIAAGFTKLPYDPKYGGAGKNQEYMNIVEVIAHQDMSLAVKQGVQFGLFGMSMYSLGTDKHHSQYLPDIMSGKLLGGFAMTEVGGGSDVQGITTEAVYDHATRSFTLNSPDESAKKAYIGNAALHGEMMVVFAQLKMSPDGESQGVHAFMVPIRDKAGNTKSGVTIEDCGHKVGLNGIDNGYLSFDKVKVPYDSMLDRFAQIDAEGNYKSDIEKKSKRFFKMISTLVTGRIFVSMVSLSGMKNALASAVGFAEDRKVFGDTLMDKQATQARLLPHLANAYALHFATRYLMDEFKKDNNPNLETMAAAIKSVSADMAMEAVDEGRKLAGGKGYMSEERYGALRSDMDIFRTFEGDNTVLRMLVAKNQLGRLSQKFNHTTGLQKLTKGIAMSVKQRMAQFNADSGKTSSSHLLDPSFQKQMFVSRERSMMYALSGKIMKTAKAEGADVAANKHQTDMLAYADAYAERIMMDKFIRAVQAQKDPAVKELLKDVCDLYAIHTMRKNALWYVENGFMKPQKTKALAELEQKLQEKIRPQAQTLVAAFDIPPSVLASPKAAQETKPQAPSRKAGGGPRL
ncbi:MAG TPA: acyl-CoA dehydrogenase [Alphaproteobacteria bacterium]|nr:acyl-CoA dehydrogenase [Alphaproteobacteria bacterium]